MIQPFYLYVFTEVKIKYLSLEMFIYMCVHSCFIYTNETWVLSNYLPLEKCIRKSWCIHTMDYYQVNQKNKLGITYTMTWIKIPK